MTDYTVIKCKNCGGTVSPMPDNPRFFRCDYCRNVQSQMDSRESFMTEKGFDALRSGEFDEAEETFGQIIIRSPDAYEAYWGRALTRFGITFVDDFRENKRVPTLHKVSPNSFVKDSDYIRAIALAPMEIAVGYRSFAEYIDRLRAGQMSVALKEKPYDIFICYKESDESMGAERTRDSYDCSDLYVHLTGLGYRVFFSRESLRGYISEEFEPYIYNALSTAKVMIVYGTRPGYMKSTWVKNEWSRYHKMIQAGLKQPNSLIVAASQMPLSQIPEALIGRQCMDADFRTFYTDLDKHIAKVIAQHNQNASARAEQAQVKASSTRFCSHCGAAVTGISRFCPKCGRECSVIDPFDHTPAPSASARRASPAEVFDYAPPPRTPEPQPESKTGIGKALSTIALMTAITFLVLSNSMYMNYVVSISVSGFIMLFAFAILRVSSRNKVGKGLAIAALVVSFVSLMTALATI